MTNREALDGGLAGTGLSIPLWIQHLEGWLQAVIIVLSLVLLIYTIRVRRLEIRRLESGLPRTVETVEDGE